MPGQRSDKNNGIRVIFFVISIFNVNVIKIYNMGEIKSITFQFNISIFTSFRGHRLHYQVHINTNNCLQELINNLLNLQTTYPIATNKSYQSFITDIVKLK